MILDFISIFFLQNILEKEAKDEPAWMDARSINDDAVRIWKIYVATFLI